MGETSRRVDVWIHC